MRTTRNTYILFLRTVLFGAVCAVLYPASTLAVVIENTADTSVTNNISITSSSGGNSAVGGEVIEGEESATIDIETVVNGETIEDIHETYTGDELDNGVTIESSHQGENVSVETTVQTSVNESGNTQAQVSEEQFSTQQAVVGSGLRSLLKNFFSYVFSFFKV